LGLSLRVWAANLDDVRFHKPLLTPSHLDTAKRARVAADARLAAEAAAQVTDDKLADWVLAELRNNRTLDELVLEWSTDLDGIDLAAIVDRRLGLDTGE
jgi:hypothetical protein